MPLVYQQNINATTKLGVWHISETEDFFLQKVSLQRDITHPNKRLQHLAGRFLLRELYPDFPYDLLRIADTRKPFLMNEAYHFSISHCGGYAAVIISTDQRVGIDIELTTWKIEKIKHKFLTLIEQDMVVGTANEPNTPGYEQVLTAAWSVKESLYKWYGAGEVDFMRHLQIKQLIVNGHEGIAHCSFLKGEHINLRVHFLFFNDNCISWVVSVV